MNSDRKLTVIFTEDEKIIRDALIAEMDWQAMGVNVLLEASDAEELFSLLQVNQADIVFMDISMPGMNGIEASRILRKEYPELHIIILTSYSDFDYVRDGLRMGIDEYLLKPVNREDVVQAVKLVRERIIKREKQDKYYKEMEAILERNQSFFIQKKYQEILLEKRKEPDEIAGDIVSEQYNFIQAAAIELHKSQVDVQNAYIEYDKKLDLLRNEIELYFREYDGIRVFMDNRDHIVILSYDNRIELDYHTKVMMKLILPNEEIYIGISESYLDRTKVAETYYQTLRALQYRRCRDDKGSILYSDISKYENSVMKINTEQFKNIEKMVRLGNRDKLVELLQKMWTETEERQFISLDILHAEAAIIMNSILKIAEVHGIEDELFEESNHQLYKKIYEIENTRYMLQYIKSCVELLVRKIAENTEVHSQTYLQDIIVYIENNIQNPDLSLTAIAKQFFMNTSYLSRVFKEYTGSNFSDYCCKKRIELSMKLLLESDRKAYEIAEEAGFRDPKYFGACFKKITGMTVNDYRSEYKIKNRRSEK